MTLRSSASSAAHGLRLDVRDALLRFARVRARRMLLHELLAARELRFGRVLEVRLRGGERVQRLERSLPVLALDARETETKEHFRNDFVIGRLAAHALEARDRFVELLLAELRLAEEKH